METRAIDLTVSNPALAGLTARRYSKKITDVPNDRLPLAILTGLQTVYEAVHGGEALPLAGNTVVVAADDAGDAFVFSRLYLPKVYKGATANALLIRWGAEEIPLTVSESGIAPVNIGKGYKVDFSFGRLNVSGRGDDAVMYVSVVKDRVLTRMPLGIAVSNVKEFDHEAANAMLKMDPESAAALFTEPSSGGGGDFEGPMVDLRALQEQLSADGFFTAENPALLISVIGYKLVGVQNNTRTSCILQAAACEAAGQSGPFHFWGNTRITNGLRAKPVITPESPSEVAIAARGNASLLLSDAALSAPGGENCVNLNF